MQRSTTHMKGSSADNKIMLKTTKRALLLLAGCTIFGGLGSAQDPAAYSGWMKAVNPSVRAANAAIAAKDNAAVATEANKLAVVFDQVLGYWKSKGADDAIKLATTARDAAKTLAAATDSDAQTASLKTLQGTCGQCHSAHRESVGPGQFNIK